MGLRKKKCPECKEWFQPRRKDAIFCSTTCRNRDNNKRKSSNLPERECNWCGTVFKPKSKLHHYCSRQCRVDAGNNKGRTAQKRRCMVCRELFEPFSNAHIYCSDKCKKIAAKKRAAKRNNDIPACMRPSGIDFFPTKSGIAGVETCSTIYNPMG